MELFDERASYVFCYAEKKIVNGKIAGGWSYTIDQHGTATYTVIRENGDPIVDQQRIRQTIVVKIMNLPYNHLLLFRDMPIQINEAERGQDGTEFYCNFGVIRMYAYNIPRILFFRPQNDTAQNVILHSYPDQVAIFDLFDRVTEILKEDGIYLSYRCISYRERGHIEKVALDDLRFAFDLPYSYIHSGVYFDGYAYDRNIPPVLCECTRRAIINIIRLCKEQLQYVFSSYSLEDLTLQELGLPEYFQTVIKESGESDPERWVEMLAFEESVCPFCNEAIVPGPGVYLSNGTSKFAQRYEKEIKKRMSQMGFLNKYENLGNFFLKDQLEEECKAIMLPKNEELTQEIAERCSATQDEIKAELGKMESISEEDRDVIQYSRNMVSLQKSSFSLHQQYQIKDEVYFALTECIEKRYKNAKKLIQDGIKADAKLAERSRKTGGAFIVLTQQIDNNEWKFTIQKEKGEIVLCLNGEQFPTLSLNYGDINTILKFLQYATLKECPSLRIVGKEKPIWSVKGACGDTYASDVESEQVKMACMYMIYLYQKAFGNIPEDDD